MFYDIKPKYLHSRKKVLEARNYRMVDSISKNFKIIKVTILYEKLPNRFYILK